jgi:hypothetical protein
MALEAERPNGRAQALVRALPGLHWLLARMMVGAHVSVRHWVSDQEARKALGSLLRTRHQ